MISIELESSVAEWNTADISDAITVVLSHDIVEYRLSMSIIDLITIYHCVVEREGFDIYAGTGQQAAVDVRSGEVFFLSSPITVKTSFEELEHEFRSVLESVFDELGSGGDIEEREEGLKRYQSKVDNTHFDVDVESIYSDLTD